MEYQILICSKCKAVIKEDAAGAARNNGKPHNYFWNAPPACDGRLVLQSAEALHK